MRTLAVAALAVVLAGSALAQPPTATPEPAPAGDMWVFVRFTDGAMAWNLHAGRWTDNNDKVEGQRLLYFEKPLEVDGQQITWAQHFWTIRCAANTYQTNSGEELTAGLATVFKLNEGKALPIRENSAESILKRVYCENIEFSDAMSATGLLGVMEAIKAQ
jgi:hypothetical protein